LPRHRGYHLAETKSLKAEPANHLSSFPPFAFALGLLLATAFVGSAFAESEAVGAGTGAPIGAGTIAPSGAGNIAPMRAGQPAAPGAGATPAGKPAAATTRGKVLETMNAANYTYARVETPAGEQWIAGPHTPLKVGDTIEWPGGDEMKGFASKTLGRTFDSILFVDQIRTGTGAAAAGGAAPHGALSGKAPDGPDVTGVARAEGGLTVAEIYDRRTGLEGKDVIVRGKVVKANSGVMNRNWLHLRDGSRSSTGENDLTVTTDAMADVGKTVVVRGKLILNKDFGFGYRYDVMVEGAKVEVE